jgi:hemolysin activation/secretion protein
MTCSVFARSTSCALAASVVMAMAAPSLAQTQSPSQVPPGQTLEQRAPTGSFSFPAAQGLTAPDGAEAIRLILRDLRVDGGLTPLDARTQALKPAVGSEVSVADIYGYAAALQAAYFKAGYPLVRVVVPAQDIEREAGIVRIQVVSGFVERIDVDSLPGAVRGRVEAVLRSLVNREPLTASEFERQLLLAGETSGLALQSALSPGVRTGGTVLVLAGEYRPIQMALAFDDSLSDDIGREQVTGSLALNSLLGLGERIILTAALSPNDISWSNSTLRRYASLYAEAPVGRNGLRLGSEVVYSASAPQGASAPLRLQNVFNRASIFVSAATLRSRFRWQNVKLSFDASTEEQTTGILGFPVPLFTDRTRVARFGIDGSEPIILYGRMGYELELSQGFNGLGARSIDDATPLRPLSRFGADAEFTRLQGALNVVMPLGGAFSAQMALRGQASFGDPLLRSEQGNIASSELISGPPAGLLVGDDTFAGRIEMRRSITAGRATLLPYTFSAAGRTWLKTPLEGERPRTDTGAIGAGIRFDAAQDGRTSMSGRLEWSHVESDQTFAGGDWLSASLTLRY